MTALAQSTPAPYRYTAAEHLPDPRARLLEELTSQVEMRDRCRASIHELTGQGDSDSLLERELAQAGAERARNAIVSVRRALDRLETGDYGRCAHCDAPIGPDRLEAIPHAELCVACLPLASRLVS